jgi:predicted nucleic acid-binding protein
VIVVDASAAIDALIDAAGHADIARCLSGVVEPLAAPDLLDVEILSVFRRWERRGEIAGSRARQALDDLQALPIIRYPARATLDRAWQLRHNLTAFDAQYVALAQSLSGRLLTTDDRMAEAARAADVAIFSQGGQARAVVPPAGKGTADGARL